MIRDIEANAGTLGVQVMVPDSNQAKAEIEKTPPPSPKRVKKKNDKPTFVTLESLLIDPDALEPKYDRHNRLIKPKKQKEAKDTDARQINSTKDNERSKDKSNNKKITKFTNKEVTDPRVNNNADDMSEPKSREAKPKNFIAKNIVKSKTKDHEVHSSYFDNYRKRMEDTDGDDQRSIDGNQSIPEDEGKPIKLVNGTYHGGDPLARPPVKNNQETEEGDKKKRYKDIYHRRKDDKEAIEKLWANSVKAK